MKFCSVCRGHVPTRYFFIIQKSIYHAFTALTLSLCYQNKIIKSGRGRVNATLTCIPSSIEHLTEIFVP